MITEEELREAFVRTNTEEPLSGGWPGLLLFAREVERMEREACAVIAEDYKVWGDNPEDNIAEAIRDRALGEKSYS